MKFSNEQIKKLFRKLASLNRQFLILVNKNNIEYIQFKMLDNALFQNEFFEMKGRLRPWEEQLEDKFLFYFIYLNIKVYIYIWIDDRNKIIELEFMYMDDYDDSVNFVQLALNSDIYFEYPISRNGVVF